MVQKTLFDLPTDAEQFSVLLPPSELRKINFSALEFATARKAVIEYIKTYYPTEFNDFVSNNGIIMLVELLAYQTAILSLRSDLLANEAFLPTATSVDAVINHLALINQKIKRATPAVADIECSVNNPVGSNINIPAGQKFNVKGDDGSQVLYEIFKAPNDLVNNIVIPAGKRAVIAYGVQGSTQSSSYTSDGSANQKVVINVSENVLEQPIRVEVVTGGVTTEWSQVEIIESSSANSQVYEARFFDGRVEFVFGNNINGQIPPAGAELTLWYRLGGGSKGRIGVGVINETKPFIPEYPYSASVTVNFRNVTPSSGGVDTETIEQAKKRAPREFATHDSIVTGTDYATVVGAFSHPVYGSVAKATAAIRTSINVNQVEVYVLAEGASVDGFREPVAASEGLKRAIQSHVDELNVLSDSIKVLDATKKAVNIDMTVVMNRNSDASSIKGKVEQAIANFFDITNWDLGKPLYVSQLYDTINRIDGVKYADVFEPADNVLATGKINSGSPTGVDVNQLITLGNKTVRYYYESIK